MRPAETAGLAALTGDQEELRVPSQNIASRQ